MDGLIDIGSLGAWSVSSSKPGYGVEALSDPDTKTLWQSEGPQPHLINIAFTKKQSVSQISLFADENKDDSYTPQRLSIRIGSHAGDLQEVRQIELNHPRGWQVFLLSSKDGDEEIPVRAHLVQVAILANHLNGKDTHVRGLKIFAPKEKERIDGFLPFTSLAFKQHGTVR